MVYPPTEQAAGEKGEVQMSGQSKIMTTLIAAVGSLLLSTVTVAAAIGPAHVIQNGTEITTYA